jgi:hypothetical protein
MLRNQNIYGEGETKNKKKQAAHKFKIFAKIEFKALKR